MLAQAVTKSGRMTVQVDAETHKALQAYSELTDIPIGRVLARAVREWMQTTGHVHLEIMTGRAGVPKGHECKSLATTATGEAFHRT